MRNDIPIGLQMAQATHAAFLFAQKHPEITTDWMRDSQYLIVVSVPDKAALLDVAWRAADRSVPLSLWREPDLSDEPTALVLGPGRNSRRLCANLPLAGKQASR